MPLKFLPFKGPRNWSFIDPDLNIGYEAPNKKELIHMIESTRKNNSLPPIDNIDIVVEHFLCSKPENIINAQYFDLPRTWGQWKKGVVTFFEKIRYDKIVPLEEAQRRADICLKFCTPKTLEGGEVESNEDKLKYNRDVNKGMTEAASDWLFEATVGEVTKVQGYEKLKTCSLCSCPLKCKVYYGGDISNTLGTDITLPNYCWQKK
jgi:hypothetical protein